MEMVILQSILQQKNVHKNALFDITGWIQVSGFWAHQFILHGMVSSRLLLRNFKWLRPKREIWIWPVIQLHYWTSVVIFFIFSVYYFIFIFENLVLIYNIKIEIKWKISSWHHSLSSFFVFNFANKTLWWIPFALSSASLSTASYKCRRDAMVNVKSSVQGSETDEAGGGVMSRGKMHRRCTYPSGLCRRIYGGRGVCLAGEFRLFSFRPLASPL